MKVLSVSMARKTRFQIQMSSGMSLKMHLSQPGNYPIPPKKMHLVKKKISTVRKVLTGINESPGVGRALSMG